jgi:chromosome segregation ATPase
VQELDGAIASTVRRLETAGPARALRSGDTLRALAGVSQREKLRRELEKLRRQRGEAAADLKRAEERLEDVDKELEELDRVESGEDQDKLSGSDE